MDGTKKIMKKLPGWPLPGPRLNTRSAQLQAGKLTNLTSTNQSNKRNFTGCKKKYADCGKIASFQEGHYTDAMISSFMFRNDEAHVKDYLKNIAEDVSNRMNYKCVAYVL
jgi:hypothetical protein